MEHSSLHAGGGGGSARLHSAAAVVGSVGAGGQRIAKGGTWTERLWARLRARRLDEETVEEEEEEESGRRAGLSLVWHALQVEEGAYREGGLTRSCG